MKEGNGIPAGEKWTDAASPSCFAYSGFPARMRNFLGNGEGKSAEQHEHTGIRLVMGEAGRCTGAAGKREDHIEENPHDGFAHMKIMGQDWEMTENQKI